MNQELSREDQLNVNLILSTFEVLSELMHNVKDSKHRHNLKRYFHELFNKVKQYEKEFKKHTDKNPEGKNDLENLYNKQMEVIYLIRDQVLKAEELNEN